MNVKWSPLRNISSCSHTCALEIRFWDSLQHLVRCHEFFSNMCCHFWDDRNSENVEPNEKASRNCLSGSSCECSGKNFCFRFCWSSFGAWHSKKHKSTRYNRNEKFLVLFLSHIRSESHHFGWSIYSLSRICVAWIRWTTAAHQIPALRPNAGDAPPTHTLHMKFNHAKNNNI